MTTEIFGNRDCVACEGSGWIIGDRIADPPQLCVICNPTGLIEADDDPGGWNEREKQLDAIAKGKRGG